jgi:hypothetical protein
LPSTYVHQPSQHYFLSFHFIDNISSSTMKIALALASALSASAFRGMRRGTEELPADVLSLYQKLENHPLAKRQEDALAIWKAQSNCGTRLCPTFDEKGRFPSTRLGRTSD